MCITLRRCSHRRPARRDRGLAAPALRSPASGSDSASLPAARSLPSAGRGGVERQRRHRSQQASACCSFWNSARQRAGGGRRPGGAAPSRVSAAKGGAQPLLYGRRPGAALLCGLP